MNDEETQSLIEGCLRYMKSARLPTPLPTNRSEYGEWRENASASRDVDKDAEDAWFELDRLAAEKPNIGWELLTQLAARCDDEDACAQIATGPLNTFLYAHRDRFSSRIEEELMRNAGFRAAYNWLQG